MELLRRALAGLLACSLALTPGLSSAASVQRPGGGKVEVFASAPASWKGPLRTLLASDHAGALTTSLPSLSGIDLDDAGAYATLAPVLRTLEASHGQSAFQRLAPEARAQAFLEAVIAVKERLAQEATELVKQASALLFDPTVNAEVAAKLGLLRTTLAPYLDEKTLEEAGAAYALARKRLSAQEQARVQKALDAISAGLGGSTLAEALEAPRENAPKSRLARFFKKTTDGGTPSVERKPPVLVQRAQEKWTAFKDLLRRTPLEMYLAAALFAGAGTFWAHHHEKTRTHVIPLGFSEIHQIEDDAAARGDTVGPMTRYLTSVNDLTMKVFETWNDSWSQTYVGDNTHKFAYLLRARMDPAQKTHKYAVYDYLNTLPEESRAALDELRAFVQVRDEAGPVAAHFEDAWSESHIDVYRTEVYTETYTDSEGNTHTEIKTRQVYDHTEHSYTYYPKEGELASQSLDALLRRHPELRFDETLLTASRTNAQGQFAAQKSRKNEGKETWTQADYQAIADRWKEGSTLTQNLPLIQGHLQGLHGDAASWRNAKEDAHSTWYITYSSYDSGPYEYQAAEQAGDRARALEDRIDEVVGGVEYVSKMTPVLEKDVQDLIAVELEKKDVGRSASSLKSEIMEIARRMYNLNMKAGFDVDRYRWWVVLLGFLFGAVGGGLLGKLWDKLAERYGWYERKKGA